MGTFYNTVPNILNTDTAGKEGTGIEKSREKENLPSVIVLDIFGHILPFIIVIVVFPYLLRNVYDVQYNFIYSIFFIMVLLLIYNLSVTANDVYHKNVFGICIVMTLLYVASYILYYKNYRKIRFGDKWP
jgi:hypothetical protein